MAYVLSFASYESELREGAQRTFLKLVEENAGVFPLELALSEESVETLISPSDYDRSNVPEIYRVDGIDFRIPLRSASRELELVFSESSDPARFPAQVQVTLGNIEKSGLWPLNRLVDLMGEVVEALPIAHAYVCEEEQLDQQVYADRTCNIDLARVPLGVFWVNYLPEKMLRNIGADVEHAIRRRALIKRNVHSGLIFATQEQPFRTGMPEDESLLVEMESLLDYSNLERRFPLTF